MEQADVLLIKRKDAKAQSHKEVERIRIPTTSRRQDQRRNLIFLFAPPRLCVSALNAE